MKITQIQAMEVLDSRGNPTVQTTVWAGDASATASVPSGASTGAHEALELRDGDKKRYGGKGVLKACKNVEGKIFQAVKGMPVDDQEKIDQTMVDLDGTENKSKLGANAILSVSLASARLAAKIKKQELFQYLAEIYGYQIKALPTPLLNVINGGAHAKSTGLDVQEFFIIPQAKKFSEKLRMGAEVYHILQKNLLAKGYSTGVGDEGGFAPKLGANEAAFKFLENSIADAGYKVGRDFNLGIDAAASEFFDKKKQLYMLKADGKTYKPSQVYKMYQQWQKKYGLVLIEDGCDEDDIVGWKFLTQELGNSAILVGDDVFVTNTTRLQMGIIQKIANAVLIKVNQIGTLTETVAAVKLAQKHNYKIDISHRSAETADSFIADLAVAVNAEYIKAGAPSRGERLAKYNRLLEIENQLE
jgi:enolase